MHALRARLSLTLLCPIACDGQPASASDTTPAASKDDKSADNPTKASPVAGPKASTVALAPTQRRAAAPTVDAAGRPIPPPTRGPIAWRAPAHWTARPDQSKPFILGEYALPGHSEDRPALCRLISNSMKPKGETAAEHADREVRRTRIRTAEGKSVLSQLEPAVEEIAGQAWHVVTIEGHYRPVKGATLGTDPKTLIADYAQMNLVRELENAPFYLRCWAPSKTLAGEDAAIRAWAAAVQYPAP